MTRRKLLSSVLPSASLASLSGSIHGQTPRGPLGLNTYCLRFLQLNDRQLIDYCVERKLDAIFLQDSLDPGVMEPKHWAEVRAWTKEAGLRIETGGGAILPKSADALPRVVEQLRMNIKLRRRTGCGACAQCERPRIFASRR